MSTVWQKETGVATGRGFDPNGYCGLFKTWVAKNAVSGGPNWYIWDDQSALLTDPYIIITDTLSPVVNDVTTGPDGLPPKFIKFGYLSATGQEVRMQHYMWWDNVAHAGFGLWSGKKITTYDATDFEYRFRGGAIGIAIHSRLASSWYSIGILDWEGDPNRIESISTYSVLTSGVSSGTSVVITLSSPAEASKFSVDKKYYIYDFQNESYVDYCKVTNVNSPASQITVDALEHNFPSGAVITSYAHRFCSFGGFDNAIDDIDGTDYYSRPSVCKIPYVSALTNASVFHQTGQTGSIFGSCGMDVMTGVLACENPNDDNLQTGMRPFIYEISGYDSYQQNTTGYFNRAYGQIKGLYVAQNNSYVIGSDAKTINSKDYVFIGMGAEFCPGLNYQQGVFILDSTSVS